MLILPDLSATQALAKVLAQQICHRRLSHLFFTGSLGLGKTTCIRFLVEELPGSEAAQVASPSFALCHHYPVQPPVLHCDLYRCMGDIPEEMIEALDQPKLVLLVEWAELLPAELWPEEVLVLHFARQNQARSLSFQARGAKTEEALAAIRQSLELQPGQDKSSCPP